MKDNVPLLKFNEMTFEEKHSEKFSNNKRTNTKSMSVKEKFKYYESIGLIEPDDDDEEADDDDEEKITSLKAKRNPYMDRWDQFEKTRKFPTRKAA